MFMLSFLLVLKSFVVFASVEKSTDLKVNQLIRQMTLAEKIGQLTQRPGEPDGNYKSEMPDLVKKGDVPGLVEI